MSSSIVCHPLFVIIHCLSSSPIVCYYLLYAIIHCLSSIVCHPLSSSSVCHHHTLSVIVHCLSSSIVCIHPLSVIHCLSSPIICHHLLSVIIHYLHSSMDSSSIVCQLLLKYYIFYMCYIKGTYVTLTICSLSLRHVSTLVTERNSQYLAMSDDIKSSTMAPRQYNICNHHKGHFNQIKDLIYIGYFRYYFRTDPFFF